MVILTENMQLKSFAQSDLVTLKQKWQKETFPKFVIEDMPIDYSCCHNKEER